MDDSKADEVIKAINTISEDLKKELEKKFVTTKEFGDFRDSLNLNGLLKRVDFLETMSKETIANQDR